MSVEWNHNAYYQGAILRRLPRRSGRVLDVGCGADSLAARLADRFDHVISLCDRVREVCPEFPGSPHTTHWSVPDPASEPDGSAAFVRVADELSERIAFFLHVIALRPTSPESN